MSEDQKTALELQREAAETKAEETNKSRTGLGTRVTVTQTRGKGTQVISYESFDESKIDTIPQTVQDFVNTTKTSDDKTLAGYLWRGFNALAYETASDPIAEFVNKSWSDDVQLQFRTAVRNYSRGVQCSIEDAVALIKPGFDKTFTK